MREVGDMSESGFAYIGPGVGISVSGVALIALGIVALVLLAWRVTRKS
jgi:hypothetical protein